MEPLFKSVPQGLIDSGFESLGGHSTHEDQVSVPSGPSLNSSRFAYADPPYIGQARRHYGAHPDYAGEVDHAVLIARLESDEFDGWALSASMKSLPRIMKLCPNDVLTLAWVKPIAPPMGDKRHYSWEPVIMRPLRRPDTYVKCHLVLSPPQFTFRARPPEHVIGEKPEGFAHWLFDAAGLQIDDELIDLFPGSGGDRPGMGRMAMATEDDPVMTGHRYGVRWMPTWPHISLGLSAHIDRKFGHLSLHLPIGVVIVGFIGDA